MEQFAACPFKFFVHSGLRAEERKLFELDIRDQGNFQHEVLACFHEQLRKENKRWRDLSPAQARERIKAFATSMVVSFREGLLQSSEGRPVHGAHPGGIVAGFRGDFDWLDAPAICL